MEAKDIWEYQKLKSGNRYFVLAKHYEKEVQSLNDAFCFDDVYSIQNIALSRFELITKLALEDKCRFINEKIIICGLGNVGFASLIYLLDLGYKEIDILVNNNKEYVKNAIIELNNKYVANLKLVEKIEGYNTYIEAIGKRDILEKIMGSTEGNSSIFLLGTPREGKYLIDPLEIHRKNINIFGGHELKGHTWKERNKYFIELLEKNKNKELQNFVNIYDVKPNIVDKVLERKNNFFEVLKYDIQN